MGHRIFPFFLITYHLSPITYHLLLTMLEELKDESLIQKVGGRFKLTALIQKRLVYLNKGARSFVASDNKKNKMQVVLQEIKEGKVYLDMDESQNINASIIPGVPLDLDFSDSV